MNRVCTFTAACAAALMSAAAGAQDFDEVTIEATHVAGNVYMLTGEGGNIAASIGADGTLIVDDQYVELADKITRALEQQGGGAPDYVLNTHWHGDHTGGNAAFGNDGIIVAHENVRVRMADPDSGRAAVAFPVITYADAVSIHINGEEVVARHYPSAHTDGDSVIHFTDSNVMHMGDQLFFKRFPYIDLDSGGSVQGLVENLHAIQGTLPEGVRIIPGHGTLTDAEGFAEYVEGVTETSRLVRDKIDQGMALDDIVSEGLPAEYDAWGRGFISTEAWITSIYNSATR